MKQKISVLILVMLVLALLMGCGTTVKPTDGTSATTTAAPTAEPTADPTKIDGQISWITFETPNLSAQLWDNIISNFNKKYPNIKVKRELFPSDRGAHINTLYAAGQLPDLMIDGTIDIAAIKGALLEIPDDIIKMFDPKGIQKRLDKYVFLPTTKQIKWGVYYNKSIFKEYSLGIPANWDEFVNVCDMIKKKGKIPIVTGGPDKPWLTGVLPYAVSSLELAKQFGDLNLSYKAQFDGSLKYSSPEYVDVVKKWKDMIDKGYYHPGTLSLTMAQMNDSFMTGESAMVVNGIWLAPVLDKAKLGFEPGWFPIPTKTNDRSVEVAYNGYFGISGNTKNPKQSLAFMKFFYEDSETYKNYLKADGNGGVLKSNPEYEMGVLTKNIYDQVSKLNVVVSGVVDATYRIPAGVDLNKTLQNIFAGSDYNKELAALQKKYEDGLKMEGRK